MSHAIQIDMELQSLANPQKIPIVASFFKTAPGQYGAGDQFIGVSVPNQRLVAKRFSLRASLEDIHELLQSPIHEHRLTALLILTYQYPKAEQLDKKNIYDFYLAHTGRINNWDLVDTSAPQIVGKYLQSHPEEIHILDRLSSSPSLWERRIAILATFPFIRSGEYQHTLKLSEKLLFNQEDLMHKAVGWMLREVGKKDEQILVQFFNTHRLEMPRTMLRYAIEKFPESQRQKYLQKG